MASLNKSSSSAIKYFKPSVQTGYVNATTLGGYATKGGVVIQSTAPPLPTKKPGTTRTSGGGSSSSGSVTPQEAIDISNAVTAVAQGTATQEQRNLARELGGLKIPTGLGSQITLGTRPTIDPFTQRFITKKSTDLGQTVSKISIAQQNEVKRLQSLQDDLNRRIADYNRKYGGPRELSPSEYKKAVDEGKVLEAQAKDINRRGSSLSRSGVALGEMYSGYVKQFGEDVTKLGKAYAYEPLNLVGDKGKIVLPGEKGYAELIQTNQKKEPFKPQPGKITETKKPLDYFIQGVKGVGEGVYQTAIVGPSELGREIAKEAYQESGQKDIKYYSLILTKSVTKPLIGLVTGPINMLSRPGETIEGFRTAFKERPGQLVGSTITSVLAFKGFGSLAKITYGKITSLGKTYIPREKLVVPEVISGKKLFPEAKSGVEALNKFNKEAYKSATGRNVVYSASDYPFTPIVGRTIKVTSGRGLVKSVDVPGLYTSVRGVSEYFLRIKKGIGDYKIFPTSLKDLFPGKPKILAIAQTPSRIPVSFRTSLAKAQTFFGKKGLTLIKPKGVPGKPYISPALEFGFKKEAEAVIQVGSTLKRTQLDTLWQKITGFSKYTKINGEVVPIYELEVTKSVGSVAKPLVQKVSVVDYASYSGVAPKVLVSKSVVSGLVSSVKIPVVSSLDKSSFVSKSVLSSGVSSLKKYNVDIKYPSVSVSSISKITPSSGVSVSRTVSDSSVVSSSVKPYIVSVNKSVSAPSSRVSLVSKIKSISKKSIPSYFIPSKKIIIPRIPSFKQNIKPVISSFKENKSVVGLFDVLVKKKGKFVKVGSKLPKGLALRKGAGLVDVTTARTFRLQQSGFGRTGDVPLPKLSQFRAPSVRSKLNAPLTFVEKSKFAINVVGEKSELKAARLLKQRFI
jgi:hypothetical protein